MKYLGRHRELLERLGPVALLVLCVLWVSWPLLVGTVLSHDHPMHLFKAWHFANEILPRGRVEGWTIFFGLGFPWGEVVPIGGDVWVGLFRVLTLGQLPWLRVYSLAVAGVLMVAALATYAFTARYFGRPAGAISGILLTYDPGALLEGGWFHTVEYGVWPVSLATAFAVFGFVSLERLIERGRPRDVCVSAAWIGAALLTHHLPLVLFAIGIPLLALDRAFRVPRARRGFWIPMVLALALGAALSAFFLLPMLSRSHYARELGVMGVSLSQLLLEITTFQKFTNVIPPIVLFAVLGVTSLRTRSAGTLFCSLGVAVFLLLSSDVLVSVLHLERVLASVVKVEALRMILVAKWFLFPLAAHAMVRIATLPLTEPALGRGPRFAQCAFALALIAAPGLWAVLVPPNPNLLAKTVTSAENTKHYGDLAAFGEWSRKLRHETPGFYRIAYLFPVHEHIATFAPSLNDTPFYKSGYTPAQAFRSLPQTSEPELLEAMSVKYALSSEAVTNPAFVFQRSFGELFLYRMARFTGNPFTLTGRGTGRLLEYAPERIRIRLSDVSRNTRVKLAVAEHPRWEATLDGRALAIGSAALLGHEYPMTMELLVGEALGGQFPAKSSGELVVRTVRRPVDWLGMGLTAAGLFTCALLLLRGRTNATLAFAISERWAKSFRHGALGVAIAVPIVLLLLTRTRTRSLPQDSLFQELPSGAMSLGSMPCERVEPLVYRCGDSVVEAAYVQGDVFGHLCMHVPGAAPRRLTVRTKFLPKLFVHTQHARLAVTPGSVRVFVDGELCGSLSTRDVLPGLEPALFDLRDVPNTRDSKLTIELEGAALHCFDIRRTPF